MHVVISTSDVPLRRKARVGGYMKGLGPGSGRLGKAGSSRLSKTGRGNLPTGVHIMDAWGPHSARASMLRTRPFVSGDQSPHRDELLTCPRTLLALVEWHECPHRTTVPTRRCPPPLCHVVHHYHDRRVDVPTRTANGPLELRDSPLGSTAGGGGCPRSQSPRRTPNINTPTAGCLGCAAPPCASLPGNQPRARPGRSSSVHQRSRARVYWHNVYGRVCECGE